MNKALFFSFTLLFCSFLVQGQESLFSKKQLFKITLATNLNPATFKDKPPRISGIAIVDDSGKNKLTPTLGFGIGWEWRLKKQWSVNTAAFISQSLVNILGYQSHRSDDITLFNSDRTVSKFPYLYYQEIGNRKSRTSFVDIPLSTRFYFGKKQSFFTEIGGSFQKAFRRTLKTDFERSYSYGSPPSKRPRIIEVLEEDIPPPGTLEYEPRPLNTPPILYQDSVNYTYIEKIPVRIGILAAIGTQFSISNHWGIETRLSYNQYLQDRVFYYQWFDQKQIQFSLSFVLK